MDKNKKLLYCILGSIFLSLMNSPIFKNAELGLLNGNGYGSSLFGITMYTLSNIISFIGVILVIIFSIILIIQNLDFKKK